MKKRNISYGLGGASLPKPKWNEEKETTEDVKVTELDKVITYIKKKNIGDLSSHLIKLIEEKFIEGITDYNKCLEYIDIVINNESKIQEHPTVKLDFIFDLFMNFEDKNITSNLINMVLKEEFSVSFLNYMYKSRAYFTDSESWAARVYEVVNDKLNTKEALKEDKMRLGIYTNITDDNIEELNKKLDMIKLHVSSIKKDIIDNEKYITDKSSEIRENSEKLIENINSTFKSSINEIQTFTNESMGSIKRILNSNPNSREEILKELEKEFNIIDAFDESIDIKERYEKLLSLKNRAIIYHPKFDEVLKYVLAGNTVCLTGPSKCGKTKIAKELANLLNLNFYNIGNIYDETIQINGYYDLNTNYNKPAFQRCFENGGITLIKNIDNAPIQAIYSLNNIISNFKYNPYIFGDKKITKPSPNFRLIMTNNNNIKLDSGDIDNLVRIDIDYDENYENSLTKDNDLIVLLHSLRKMGLNITTSTFEDITHHLNLGLISIEELLKKYIIEKNSHDLLKRKAEEINGDNKYNNILKKVLKG